MNDIIILLFLELFDLNFYLQIIKIVIYIHFLKS